MSQIDTLDQLVRAVSASKTRGYEAEFTIEPNRKAYDGFLVILVSDTDPETQLLGEWWFDGDNRVMQVL